MPQRHHYGEHRDQFADVYRAQPQVGERGVVVVIHGGFWKSQYDATLGAPLGADLAERGWTALNLEYRRVGSPGTAGLDAVGREPIHEAFDDIHAAINLLRDLDLDTGHVVTLGHSAGGHLATWAAARHRFDRWRDAVPVTGVVAQAPVLDLVAADADNLGSGAVAAFVGAPGPHFDLVDPARQIPLQVPVRCVHPSDDVNVPIAQSRNYVRRAQTAGADASLVEVTGGHMAVIDVSSPAWDRVLEALAELTD